jgi:hypothetical protein
MTNLRRTLKCPPYINLLNANRKGEPILYELVFALCVAKTLLAEIGEFMLPFTLTVRLVGAIFSTGENQPTTHLNNQDYDGKTTQAL